MGGKDCGCKDAATPLVSVIVPTFGRPLLLGRAIDSLLAQTYRNIEVIVVSDNPPESEDDRSTADVVASFEDDRLRRLRTSGSVGGGKARNYACGFANGDYLAFLDDDDEFMPDKIESQLSFMIAHDLEMCYQDAQWFDESGRLVEYRRLDHATGFDKESLLRAHVRKPISPTGIYMLTRDLFFRTAGFGDVKTGQDWLLMLGCIEEGARIGYMPESHIKNYVHKGARISAGKNKIDGENQLHRYRKGYYHRLTRADRRYCEFRHNAVLSAVYMRDGRAAHAFAYALRAFFTSPQDCVVEGFRFCFGKRRSAPK